MRTNYDFALRFVVRDIHQVAHVFTAKTHDSRERNQPLGKLENWISG